MPIVLFDLDGTLTQRDTYFHFLLLCARKFGVRWRVVYRVPAYLALYSLGRITRSRLKEVFLETVLQGVSLVRLEPVVDRYVSVLIERGLNLALLHVLRQHLEMGDRVILVTASFDLYVERLAERLKIAEVVCTRAEVNRGLITGRILGENCRGQEKVRRLEGLLASGDWAGSILYTDHHADLPLLKRVSHGVLVNPGPRTKALLRGYNFVPFTAQ